MPKLACLARCNGANPVINYASDITVEAFRSDVRRVCSLVNVDGSSLNQTVMIASYARPILNQTGSGHFSPVGAYNSDKDMCLIMDVARFKYPAHWVPLPLLFQAMQSIDSDSKKSRGYVLLTVSSELISSCGECCIASDVLIDANSCSGEGGGGGGGGEVRIPTSADVDSILSPNSKSDDAHVAQAKLKSLTEHKCSYCT